MDARGQRSSSYGSAPVEPHDLARVLGDLARSLQDEVDVQRTLHGIVQAAVDTVPGAEFASISAVEHRREVRTVAATHDVANAVDKAQYDTGQGPCLDTLYERQTVRLSDVPGDQRWPQFVARAAELGIGSMLSVQLYVTGDDLGALNLHSRQSDAFDDESENIALLFATHAAVALVHARTEEQLRQGISTRDLIGQAKGILIERHKITGDQAFRLLVVASQRTNRKLYDIAIHLVTSGELAAR